MLNQVSRKIGRVPGKLKLSLLGLPVIKSMTEAQYRERLAAFASSIPVLSPSARELAAAIDRDGLIFTTISDLPFTPKTSLIASIEHLLPELQSTNGSQENSIRMAHERIIKHPDVYLWGLDENLLDLAENCIGLPAFYHRVEIRRDLVNENRPTSASQWHRDPADHRIFKLIIYLNDVESGGGPFEFVSRADTARATRELRYHSGYLSDDEMSRVVPRRDWKLCTGGAGSVAIGDTASVFHRIRPPVSEPRLSITYTYTSRRPIRVYDETPLSPKDVAAINEHLTDRQRRCLFRD